eukprot:gene10291-11388_t
MTRLQEAAQQGDVRVMEQLKVMETNVSYHCNVSMKEVHALKQSLQDAPREVVKALEDKLEALDLLSLKDDLAQVKNVLQGLKEAAASQADKQRLEEQVRRLEEKIDGHQAITLQELEGLRGLVKRDEAEVAMKVLVVKIDSLDLLSVRETLVEVKGEVIAALQELPLNVAATEEIRELLRAKIEEEEVANFAVVLTARSFQIEIIVSFQSITY